MNIFPGISENGIWTYDDLINSGFSAHKLERWGIQEGESVQVQFDEYGCPFVTPMEHDKLHF